MRIVCAALLAAFVSTAQAKSFVFSFSGGGARSAGATNTFLEVAKNNQPVWASTEIMAGISGGCWGVSLFCGHDGNAMNSVKQFAAKKGKWAEMSGFRRLRAFSALYEEHKGSLYGPLISPIPGVGSAVFNYLESWVSPGNAKRRECWSSWLADINAEVALGKPNKDITWEMFSTMCQRQHKVEPQCFVGYDKEKTIGSVKAQVVFTKNKMIVSKGSQRTETGIPRKMSVESGSQTDVTALNVMGLSSSAWTYVTAPLNVKFDGGSDMMLYDQGIDCNLPLSADWHSKDVIVLFDNSDNGDKGLFAELDRCIAYWRRVHGGSVRKGSPLTRSPSASAFRFIDQASGNRGKGHLRSSVAAPMNSLITPLTVFHNTKIYHVPLVGMTGNTIDQAFSRSHPTFQSGAMSFFPANYPASKLASFSLYETYLKKFLLPLLAEEART